MASVHRISFCAWASSRASGRPNARSRSSWVAMRMSRPATAVRSTCRRAWLGCDARMRRGLRWSSAWCGGGAVDAPIVAGGLGHGQVSLNSSSAWLPDGGASSRAHSRAGRGSGKRVGLQFDIAFGARLASSAMPSSTMRTGISNSASVRSAVRGGRHWSDSVGVAARLVDGARLAALPVRAGCGWGRNSLPRAGLRALRHYGLHGPPPMDFAPPSRTSGSSCRCRVAPRVR